MFKLLQQPLTIIILTHELVMIAGCSWAEIKHHKKYFFQGTKWFYDLSENALGSKWKLLQKLIKAAILKAL